MSPVTGRTDARGIDARAWVLAAFAVTILLLVVADLVTLWQHMSGVKDPYGYWFEGTVFTLAYAVLGALIGVRAPGNRMGTLMLAVAASGAVQAITGALAGSSDKLGLAPRVSAWMTDVSAGCQRLVAGGIVLLLLLAPTGHPLNPRWRLIVGATGAGVAASAAGAVLFGTDREGGTELSGVAGVVSGALDLISITILLGLVAAPVCLGLRWRRARGLERQQVTWVALGGLAGPCLILLSALPIVQRATAPIDDQVHGSLVWALAPAALPAGIAVAVLRHQLYDIDRIIGRTTAYAIVTGMLLAVYAIIVTSVTRLLPGASNAFAVAAATLAAAALFRPLLSRVQAIVDRRFNRTRYDAQRTVEAFASRLRDQVDPDDITAHLLGALHSTLEPAHMALWLRGASMMADER